MNLFTVYCGGTASLLGGALGLHLVAYFEESGSLGEKKVSDRLCEAPAIDIIVAFFTLLPNILGVVLAGWIGFAIAIAAQLTALLIWVTGHELAHYRQWQGPKISRTQGRLVGNWKNHLALWITLPAISVFWLVRLQELLLYPILTWAVRFPRYDAKDWVTVSRHKFEGLVGYDLIWCLYCDWMTGVWSLGTEMLRNVESFWCPIRFYPDKKCENCKIDFPDLEQDWVSANSDMTAVVEHLQDKYTNAEQNAWYGPSAHKILHEGDEPVSSLDAKPHS